MPKHTGTSVTAVPRSGCFADENERHEEEESGDDEIAVIAGAAAVLAEVHGENEREHHPAELGRLEVEETERNPARRPAGADTADEHVQQEARRARRRGRANVRRGTGSRARETRSVRRRRARRRRAGPRSGARGGRHPRAGARRWCCRSSPAPMPASSSTAPRSSQSMWKYRRRSNMS